MFQYPNVGQREIHGLDLPQQLPTAGDAEFDFRRGPDPLVHEYDGHQMPYADGSLAIATLNFTLHHIEPPSRSPQPDSPEMQAFLDELKRVLKPGGVVLVMEDYMGKTQKERQADNPFANNTLATDNLFYPHSLGSQRSQEEWVTLLKHAGFAVERTKRVAGYNVAGFPVVELVIKARKPAK